MVETMLCMPWVYPGRGWRHTYLGGGEKRGGEGGGRRTEEKEEDATSDVRPGFVGGSYVRISLIQLYAHNPHFTVDDSICRLCLSLWVLSMCSLPSL
jgi:hypothetical protein